MFLLSKLILDLIIAVSKAHLSNLFLTLALNFKSFLALFSQLFLPYKILFLCYTSLLGASAHTLNASLLLNFMGTSSFFLFLLFSRHFLLWEKLIYKGAFSSLYAK